MEPIKGIAKNLFFKKRGPLPEADPAKQRLLEEIHLVCQMMQTAHSRFSAQSDGDLMEACIYEMEALKARYRYLNRQARELGITCQPYEMHMDAKEGNAVG